MEQWKEYRLEDFIHFNPTISLKKGTVARKIAMDNLIPHSRKIYSWSIEPYSGGAKFQNGDTIMARITPCLENGKHSYVSILDEGEIAYGSTEYIVMRGINGISNNLFIYYLSQYSKFKNAAVKSMVGSSGRQRAQVDVLKNLAFNLPGLTEQKRIADFLSSLDDKIELNRQINDNLEQQAQALFKSWFVDFEPFKDGEFVDSELGMIPKGWKIGTLGDIADVSSGKRPPMKQSEMTPDINIPLIGASSVMGFTNEVLYNKAILVIGRVGTHGIVQRFNTPCWPSDNTLVIETTFYEYVNQILRVIDYKSLNRGSTQPLITQTDLKNQMVLIPNEKVLCDYNEIASKAMIKFDFNLSEINHLVTIRDTLLPRLMSGELKINEINC